jgi:uncharacterized protein
MLKVLLSVLFLAMLTVVLLGLALHFLQHRLIFFPTVLPQDHVFHFSVPVEEVFLDTGDGVRIHALHFKAEQPRGAVLYFHGNAGDLSSWGQVAGSFLSRGYSVLMPDYRGHGKSVGSMSEEALHADARLMLEHLLRDHPLKEIVVYGRSIGTGIALPLAAGLPVKALVLETPFTQLADVAAVHYPWLPVRPLLRYPFNNTEALRRVTSPTWIIHGTHDRVIPYPLAATLAASAGREVRFITVEGGGHNDLERFPEFQRMLDEVLER